MTKKCMGMHFEKVLCLPVSHLWVILIDKQIRLISDQPKRKLFSVLILLWMFSSFPCSHTCDLVHQLCRDLLMSHRVRWVWSRKGRKICRAEGSYYQAWETLHQGKGIVTKDKLFDGRNLWRTCVCVEQR